MARGYRIMAITSAFQADDAGSIPATRSTIFPLSLSFQQTARLIVCSI